MKRKSRPPRFLDLDDRPNDALNEEPTPKPSEKSYTWSSTSTYAFQVRAFVTQTYLRKLCDDCLEMGACQPAEFEYNHGRRAVFLNAGNLAFSIAGRIYHYRADVDACSQTLSSNADISELVMTLKREIKENNPLRRKHLQLVASQGDFRGLMKPVPSTTFNKLVLDPLTAADIFDNTILQMESLNSGNGIILHGRPGTGKSLTCQAIVHEAIQRGLSTCYVMGEADFSGLDRFLQEFLDPCIVIFEDIDAFACNRFEQGSSVFADFLQMLSGLTERREQRVVVATTNHLEALDDAIRNRPVRFNRKYRFQDPTNDQIDHLLELYFGAALIPPQLKRICHDQGFTGAHISEVKRTTEMLAHKRNLTLPEVFADAVQVVQAHFSPKPKQVGFGMS